jgi:isopentenyldiphosphate isomerase
MEEIVDIYNPDTLTKTGEVISKNIAHQKGIWHSSIHLIIVNKDRLKTLFQQRASNKDLYPNSWDIAVGGHISAGESDILAVKRELQEELGIESNDIKFIKRYKEELNNNGINNKEIVNLYILEKDINISDITLQDEEVRDARWITKEEMDELINSNQVIPHTEEYKILRKILK